MDDFDFVPGMYNNSSAAPKISEYDFPEFQEERKVQRKKKPASQPVANSRLNAFKLVAALILCGAMLIGVCSAIIFVDSIVVNNTRTISSLERQMDEAKAENIRLSATLNSAMSVDKIQEYAVSTLGMQKAERYQIHYFEDRDGDKVVVANGKAQNADKQVR